MEYRNRLNKQKSDFAHSVIDVRRVARVMAGGRRFSFRVAVVAGNKKGEVGMGIGKAADTATAIEKAFRHARKNAIKPNLTKDFSIPYQMEAKYSSARILLRPAQKGRGLIAGSSLRTVLELAGIKNVTAKIISRSKNKLNIANATIKALSQFRD